MAREDLAEVAARVAGAPAAHRNVTYELAGAAAITAADLARELDVPYEPSSFSATRAGLDSAGLLPFQPAMLISIYSATAAGFMSSTHSDLERLLTHSPRDIVTIAAAAAA